MRTWLVILLAAVGPCVAQQPVTFGTTVVVPSGLRGEVYHLRHNTWMLPDFDKLESVGSIWTTMLNIPPRHWRDGFPGVTKRNEWFGIVYTGRFWIGKPGSYRFALTSDDGSQLFIDDQLVVDNDCQHPPLLRESVVELAGGLHRMRVSYFQGPRDCIALVLAIQGPDDDEWRVFSTEEFKPPSNPEEWKFGNASELRAPVDPDENRRRLGESGRQRRKTAIVLQPPAVPARSADGCVVPDAVPICRQ